MVFLFKVVQIYGRLAKLVAIHTQWIPQRYKDHPSHKRLR